MQAALVDIWVRNLPLIQRRLDVVERAATELAGPSPDSELIALGRSEAHRLAGTLGTFGLGRGTALARSLEDGLSERRAGERTEPMRLAAELRSLVDGTRTGS